MKYWYMEIKMEIESKRYESLRVWETNLECKIQEAIVNNSARFRKKLKNLR